ncbi:alpha-taxilin [Atheta coriaria]|uniref:alpha-taxilin n=1 Tax=Dalotia coriaria TaxID=877792 RepID=UPI0031F43A09
MEAPAEEKITNGQKRKEVKFRRRDNRCLENILRSVSTLSDVEKFEELKSKYVELYDQVRVAHNNHFAMENKTKAIQHQMEALRNDHTKSLLARSRLESLCRELQKQNKIIKEENLTKIKEEEELRKEFAGKFQTTLAEVTNMLQENNDKNMKLRDDNQDMAKKLSTLCSEFQSAEQEIARMSSKMNLEKQLSDATLAKVQYELKAERDLWTKEREMLNQNLNKSEETCAQLQQNIKALETHLQMYTGKYEEFENTISKSSQVFDSCKNEMVKMTKQNGVLDKELKNWKSRCEHYAKVVLDLTAAKQVHDKELHNAEKKIEQLQKLCRQLQVDRAAYLKLLKMHSIEPSSQICVDNNSGGNQQANFKPTKKEQELSTLKNSLKALEEQFAILTTTPDPNGEASPEVKEILETGATNGANGTDNSMGVENVPATTESETVPSTDTANAGIDTTAAPETAEVLPNSIPAQN